jgi:8-oxo-dGTP pyrophosphatase MutT (NUDIX family)
MTHHKKDESMAKLIYGDRISRRGKIQVGCSAILTDYTQQRILLTQRSDNGRWCLPGGRMDPGESVEECCIREFLEETGLHVQIIRLIGIYSNPNLLVKYSNNSVQIVAFNFEVKKIAGLLKLTDETSDYGYFSPSQMNSLDIMENHHERVLDYLTKQAEPFIH